MKICIAFDVIFFIWKVWNKIERRCFMCTTKQSPKVDASVKLAIGYVLGIIVFYALIIGISFLMKGGWLHPTLKT